MNLEIKHLASYLQWELKLIQKKDWHSENWVDSIIQQGLIRLEF